MQETTVGYLKKNAPKLGNSIFIKKTQDRGLQT